MKPRCKYWGIYVKMNNKGRTKLIGYTSSHKEALKYIGKNKMSAYIGPIKDDYELAKEIEIWG